ncbi:hypothetical protein J4E90_007704 [Alternaria incomplexa]|uniref:uncharacterized protein n=1 Tax=Alternaria incomplexa TaxID=1187928 RepID=UPI00221FB996|nr:uncharacterized protein J4E90_007704 [Alternaria incomplexa]KAI4910271.1 hypothetical protein J4E90_007704 [Alternaria incomplexa]
MGPATGKEKRGRAKRKPQISVRKLPKAGSKFSPGFRVGASQDLPITLDSDDDAPTSTPQRFDPRRTHVLLAEPNLRGFRYDGTSESPRALPNTSHAPIGFVLRRSSPTYSGPAKDRPHAVPQETLQRDSDGDEEASPIRKPATRRARQPRALDGCRKESKPGTINMSLMDIDDFGLRSKVAQLMAVAPALPIMDLYHLIMDSEGDLPLAKKQAIRMSEAPPAQYQPGFDADGEEVMVKIDPNDPAFEWDDDEPQPESAATTASRPQCMPKNKATKSKSLYHHPKPSKSAKSGAKHCSNTSAKRMKSSSMNPTHARETSSDREFIVPDNTVHYDLNSDISNGSDEFLGVEVRSRPADSDVEILDGEDPLDLDIDMQPRFAYNARPLGRRARG